MIKQKRYYNGRVSKNWHWGGIFSICLSSDLQPTDRELLGQVSVDRAEHDKPLVSECGNSISDANAPELPTEIPGHNIMSQWRIVLFNINRRHSIVQALQDFWGTAVDAEEATKAIWICEHPVRDNGEVQEPQEHKRIVAVETSTELVSKVEDGRIVDKHEQTDECQHFALIIIGQQPPLGKVHSVTVELVAAEPL